MIIHLKWLKQLAQHLRSQWFRKFILGGAEPPMKLSRSASKATISIWARMLSRTLTTQAFNVSLQNLVKKKIPNLKQAKNKIRLSIANFKSKTIKWSKAKKLFSISNNHTSRSRTNHSHLHQKDLSLFNQWHMKQKCPLVNQKGHQSILNPLHHQRSLILCRPLLITSTVVTVLFLTQWSQTKESSLHSY